MPQKHDLRPKIAKKRPFFTTNCFDVQSMNEIISILWMSMWFFLGQFTSLSYNNPKMYLQPSQRPRNSNFQTHFAQLGNDKLTWIFDDFTVFSTSIVLNCPLLVGNDCKSFFVGSLTQKATKKHLSYFLEVKISSVLLKNAIFLGFSVKNRKIVSEKQQIFKNEKNKKVAHRKVAYPYQEHFL